MTEPLRARVLAYLASHHVMTLATCGAAGPWAAAIFYANEGFELYFLSAPSTRHARDLAGDPRVAATIHEDRPDWPAIRGVQLEGTAVEVDPAEVARVRRLYGEKFPVVADAGAPAAIAAALSKVSWYRLTPSALFFVDNTVAFGHRDRVDLP